jgi:peptidoglycan/LPS O-acetylase OafA/YrhL
MAHSGHPTGRVLLDVASYGLLAQAWAFWHWSLNAPAWTVSAFASFYLLFPFVGAWLKRRSTTGLWITAAGCLAASCAIALVAVAVMSSAGEIIYANTKSAPVSGFSTAVVRCVHNLPLARLPEFLCGMVLAVLVKRGAIPAALCRHGFVAGALAIVALIACARWVPYLLMNNALFIIPSAAIILGSLHRHAWLEKTLGHRWMGMLGCASFSLYLVHIPLLTYFRLACDTLGLPTGGAAFELAYLALVIPASVLVYSGVEEPIRLALRKFGPAKAAKTPPAEIPRAPAPAIGESVVTARPRPVASVATASFDHDSVPARSPAHAAVEVPVLAGCS